MGVSKARHAGGFFVDFGVVLHGARAQRVHGGIDTHVALRNAGKVANDFRFAQFGQFVELVAPQQMRRQGGSGHVALGQAYADAPGSG